MPPKTRLQRENTIRALLQKRIAYIGRADLIGLLDMNEQSMLTWEQERAGEFPIEAYFLATGAFVVVIYPLFSVLEYISGTARAERIMLEEGYTTNG